MASTRRLTAILVADVAGYSRLMGADEEGTHERLKAHLGELVNPKIKEHRGHTVKNTGDGFLAEFASVVDAVRCAAELQRGMIGREAEVPEQQRIRFRVGVNLGDVIVEEHDIFGDGVNVAARLEALAEPGGVCVSRVVRDQVRDRLDYTFKDLGEQRVKNIARPVRAYALRPDGLAPVPAPRLPARPFRRGKVIVGTIAGAVLVIACIAWWFWPAATSSSGGGKLPDQATASATLMPTAPPATSNAQPVVAPRLSIVVLPFANLSNDPEQQYLADGVTEDLTTDLSRISHMFVISRNSAFTYKDRPVNAKQVGRELGVRYVLEGSVRRSGNQVRVSAQLIDAATDAHLWAERFDHDMDDLFALQNEITGRIARALNLSLIDVEANRPTEHPDALDYILRGRAASNRTPTHENFAQAVDLFEHAVALDPQSVEAHSLLALSLTGRVLGGMSNTLADDLLRARELVDQALATSPGSIIAHSAKAQLLLALGHCDEAIPEYEMAIASDRNSSGLLFSLGFCKLQTGAIDETIPLAERAIRLSPRDPFVYTRYNVIGLVHLLQSRTDEAIAWLERARIANPGSDSPHGLLASAYALRGDLDRAAAELAEARRLSGGMRYNSINRMKTAYWKVPSIPSIRELYEATVFAGLRKAGVPEE
jgi:adenylate cyclase